ncbi:MAG: hypothetical protein K0S24_1870 [Sphingobacterium sp.]|jgi:hypothetical protein|nr:hypothetical protein [Sphingobacterium sp.]
MAFKEQNKKNGYEKKYIKSYGHDAIRFRRIYNSK